VKEVIDLEYSVEMLDIELLGEDHAYVARGFYQHNSCADMFKIILSRLNNFLADKKSKMIMNIHDEVIFYLHKEEIHILPDIKDIFEDWDFRVPIIAEVQYSEKSWGDKEEL
jgi:DNA polymerase I-like protein with 3'-5' exonuclease and polymerase domains